MNHKQKLGYTVLGAVIMLIGIGVGSIVSPPLIAQRNGVFDEIQCTTLTMVDKAGNPAIDLFARDEVNGIIAFDKSGKPAISLLSAEEGVNGIAIYSPAGEEAVILVATEQQSEIDIYNPAGVKAIKLFSDSEILANGVTVYNQTGVNAVNLASHKELGNRVILCDKTGNAKWTRP